jgi:hypothetical protein
MEPSLSANWIDLPTQSFTNHLVGSRVTFTATPLLFASALIQYNATTHIVSTNARLRWEYRPGSELFVVFNENRDRSATGTLPELQDRSFIIKVNRFFRF